MSASDVSQPPARLASASAHASDARLVRRAAKRDEKAFAAIFNRYHQEIYRFCLAILGNAEDARDALQNTMVKALRALPGEDRQIQLRPWLYRVAHNEAVEIVRTRETTATIDPELEDPVDNLANAVGARERLRRLLCDLADLPERQRAALVMRELGGFEFAQIGEFFDTSEDAARQAVYEARLSLRSLEAGREMSCEEVMHRLSNADGRVNRRRDIKAHLRACPDCRAFQEAIEARRRDFAAIAPLPALVSAGVFHAVLGSAKGAVGAAAGGAGATGGATAAAGAGKALTAGLVAKSVATVAVVAAVGVTAADRGGLIHTGLPGSSSSAPTGQESDSGASETQAGDGSSTGSKGKDGSAKAKAKKRSKAHGKKSKGHHGKGAAAALPPASQHGQETSAAHKGGASASHGGQGHSASATHRSSHRASHGHGRSKASAHRSNPPAASSPSKSSQEEGGKGSTGETSPTAEQTSGLSNEKVGSGTESEGMP